MQPVPSLEETLKIARSLTHSGFTQAKADQVVAGIEQAINPSGIAVGVPFHLQLPSGTVLRGRVDPACEKELEAEGVTSTEVFAALQLLRDNHAEGLLDPDVSEDEIDEDPPSTDTGQFTAAG